MSQTLTPALTDTTDFLAQMHCSPISPIGLPVHLYTCTPSEQYHTPYPQQPHVPVPLNPAGKILNSHWSITFSHGLASSTPQNRFKPKFSVEKAQVMSKGPPCGSNPSLISSIKVLKNKKDERGIVIRNKARLVAQGHTQEEGIDYDEVFTPVDPKFPVRVYKVEKAMYGLHQAPRAWYGTLSKYLLTNGFQRGTIDQTLFIRRQRGDFILVQVYVDDIIFGSSNPQLCREFEALMHEKFQMSAMGELNFFLGLQVLQKKDSIFLSQDKYIGDILKKFGYSDVRSANTPMDKENPWGKDKTGKDVDLHLYRSMIGSLMYLTASRPDIMFAVFKRIFRYLNGHPKLGLWYPKESPFDLVAYSDSDYGGAS
nr:hypothetical protein [Tanacetum cinerariifolium]